jgi:crotonobetainyl-CoA:carnitine CoA-transferase CaiB-like acyl-CoA transferase
MMDLLKPDPAGAPARSLPGMGDHPTGMALLAAILLGLYRRERTGEGANVSTSLMSNGLWSNAFYAQAALAGVEVPRRPPHDQAPNAMANHYQCSDGRWFILALLNEDLQWPVLTRVIGREDLRDDPRFATTEARHRNGPALAAELIEAFAKHDWPYWRHVLHENRLTFGNVSIMEDLREDEQMRESGALVPIAGDNPPCELTIDSPVRIEGEAKRPPAGAPALGAHSEVVLREAGYSEDEIQSLIAAGAVRT